MDRYLALSELYALIRGAYGDRIYVDREISNKTRDLLQKHTISGQLELPGAIHALGPEELAKLRESDTSDNTKILNLRKILAVTVQDSGASKPFLLSIGERAEKIAADYEDRQLTTQQALLEFEKLAREATEADVERQRLGLDENSFAIHKTVGETDNGFDAKQAKGINALFEQFPDYRWNKQQESKLRTELYKTLRPHVGTGKMIDVANRLLKLQSMKAAARNGAGASKSLAGRRGTPLGCPPLGCPNRSQDSAGSSARNVTMGVNLGFGRLTLNSELIGCRRNWVSS